MTVPYGVFCYVLPFNKCSVGRGALTPPQLCFIAIYKSATNLTPFVGDDACIVPHVGPCLISPTSNSAARLNFHHHKKHMPAHSAPGICFFCYRTINLFPLRHRIIILYQQIHAGPIAFHAQGLVIPAQKTGIHRAACLFDRAFPLGPIGVVVGQVGAGGIA